MKKKGFTLAEVLITLTIIGVVATLTLPSLMANTAEQQAQTAFKKMINTLSEAGQMNSAINGFDYSSISANSAIDDDVQDTISLAALFNSRLQVDNDASGTAIIGGDNCGGSTLNTILRDGTAICYATGSVTAGNAVTDRFINVWVDVNGTKGPNLTSTCDAEGCENRAQRAIRDQFPVTLVGAQAIPGHWTAWETAGTTDADFAARFAMGTTQRTGGNG